MRLLASSLLATMAALTLASCATTFEPKVSAAPTTGFDLVDPAKVDRIQYAADHAECAALANQDSIDPQRMATGALGAAADKISFGILGNKPGHNADRITVLKRCLEGRGYKVLR
jgi:hypothetical protein